MSKAQEPEKEQERAREKALEPGEATPAPLCHRTRLVRHPEALSQSEATQPQPLLALALLPEAGWLRAACLQQEAHLPAAYSQQAEACCQTVD